MNYPLGEVWDLLDGLTEARAAAGSAPYPSGRPPMTMVIPEALPTPELHAELAARGVTATIGMPWFPGDPASAPFAAKRDAMRSWAQRFGL